MNQNKLKYFHTLTKKQYNTAIKTMSFIECGTVFKPPQWCSYPEAIASIGCWSILSQQIKKKKDCLKCEYINKEANYKNYAH